MIPTSKDCIVTTGIVVRSEAPMEYLVDPDTGQTTISLGRGVELVFDEGSLDRLDGIVQAARRELRATQDDDR